MKVILAGGGTAGHINPALAIASKNFIFNQKVFLLCVIRLFLLKLASAQYT